MMEVDERQRRIGAFAAELYQLRVSAGTPSFRKIASLSGCISHTTLAEAEKGLRLPSWETTREFVKGCQGDEADWRGRWEKAKEAITPQEPVLIPPPSSETRKRHPRISPVRGAMILFGIGALVAAIIMITLQNSTEKGTSTAEKSAPTTDEGTLVEGDGSSLIRDVTFPDKVPAEVQVGEKFVKVWEFMNTGKVAWRSRYLLRQDLPVSPDTCRTTDRVPIGDTLPNERILISVEVTAASKPTTCKIYWKMVDSQGHEFFPSARRPVYFWVYVVNKS